MWWKLVVMGVIVATTAGPVWALDDIEQDQFQRQSADAEARAVQKQTQASSQSNTQVTHEEHQRQNVAQVAPALYLGQAQEGLAVGLPWANASLAQQSEVTKLVSCGSFAAAHATVDDPRVQDAADACLRAAHRCGLLCRVSRLLF